MKNIDTSTIIHQFRNECGELFVIFYKDNHIWITGDEHDWKEEDLFKPSSFIYSKDEILEILKVFSLDHIKFHAMNMDLIYAKDLK